MPAKKRNYRQCCALAKALDVVGERWTLLIVRNLLVGPERYGELLSGLPGVTTNLLAKRLREMTKAGLVRRESDEHGGEAYALTKLGRQLEPVVFALGNFGERYLAQAAPSDAKNVRWAMLSIKRRYRGGECGAVELRPGASVFQLKLEPNAAELSDGTRWTPDVVVSGSETSVAAAVTGRASSRDLEATGELHVLGSRRLYRRFLRSIGVAG